MRKISHPKLKLGWLTMATIATLITGRNSQATSPPIVRPTGYVQQTANCYIEMPNQLQQNLDELCQMGKPKAKKAIDMTTDRNGDGVPDELAAEFRQLDALESRSGSMAAAQVSQRQVMQKMMEINERLPYAESTRTAMREMFQIIEAGMKGRGELGMGNPAQFRRMEEIQTQVRKDPVFQQVEAYSSRFQQQKYAKMMPR